MKIEETLSLLDSVKDKDLVVVMPVGDKLVPVCLTDSGVAWTSDGRMIFVMMPCDHEDNDEQEETFEYRVDDFPNVLN